MDRDERNMKAMGSCSRVVVGLVCAWWITSCAQVIGADDYRLAQAGGTGGAPEGGTSGAPDEVVAPFLTAPACESCMQQYCSSEAADCSASQECRAWLADIRANPDPVRAYARDRAIDEVLWARQGEKGPDILSEELKTCAEKSCLDECQYGQDFSCVNAFNWDIPYPAQVRVRATNWAGGPTADGWQITPCQAKDRCMQPLAAPVHTDDSGFASLNLESDGRNGLSPLGYLRFEAPVNYVPWEVTVSRPYATGDYGSWGLIDDATVASGYLPFEETFDSAHGLIMVVPMDCAGLNAKQVSVEAWLDTPDGLEQCKECRIAYENAEYAPRFTPQELSTKGRQVYIGLAPPQLVHVVVRRSRPPGTVVSVASIDVKGGEGHIVRTYPASRQERAAFPY